MKYGCRIKQEPKLLLDKAVDSLMLSIEILNRPSDVARVHSSLILLHHALEMFLKAAILHRKGKILETGETNTVSFETCIRKGLSDARLHFLDGGQALVCRAIDGYRDASYHYLLSMSEDHLYAVARMGVDNFCDLMKSVFQTEPSAFLPERVLPISAVPPQSIDAIFSREVERVRQLMAPKKKTHFEAKLILRSLEILEGSTKGAVNQPATSRLDQLAKSAVEGASVAALFPNVAGATISNDGDPISIALKTDSSGGLPVRWWKPGDPEDDSVPIKKVANESFYSLGKKDLAGKLGLSEPRCCAMRRHFNIEGNDDYHKVFRFGKTQHDRYSPKALDAMKEGIGALTPDELEQIWQTHRTRPKPP